MYSKVLKSKTTLNFIYIYIFFVIFKFFFYWLKTLRLHILFKKRKKKLKGVSDYQILTLLLFTAHKIEPHYFCSRLYFWTFLLNRTVYKGRKTDTAQHKGSRLYFRLLFVWVTGHCHADVNISTWEPSLTAGVTSTYKSTRTHNNNETWEI